MEQRATPSSPRDPPPTVRAERLVSGHPFVGREAEMAELLTGLTDATGGRGRLFLIRGEPGIGKSRLADEFGKSAAAGGARVLWGRCWEAGGAPAYWPWIHALRAYIRELPAESLHLQAEGVYPDIGRLLPELQEHLSGEIDASSDPDAARFRLLESVTAFLWNAAQRQPLVLILEDLHAADAPSLLLLRFLASELAGSRLLILATYRDVAPVPHHRLSETEAELGREQASSEIHLQGLAEPDVSRLIELTTGQVPSARVVTTVHRETDGNPLFLSEMIRLLSTEGRLEDIEAELGWRRTVPDRIRDVIDRRLRHLSSACHRLIATASVIGREFSVDILTLASGTDTAQALGDLEEALAGRVIARLPGSAGVFRFSHVLVRDTLYDDLPLPRRLELHARIGEIIDDLYVSDAGPHLAEVAAHFVEAAPLVGPRRALEYVRRAGDWALQNLAYEEAARLYRVGLQLLEGKAPSEEKDRCELLLTLGEARLRAGDTKGAKHAYWDAALLARRQGFAKEMARAALGYGGRFVWTRAGRDRRVVPLLQEALGALGEHDGVLRSRLLARLAGALRDRADRGPRADLSLQALEMARRIGDPSTTAFALVSRYTSNWGPENAEEQLAIAEELVELADSIGDRDREVEGHLLRVKTLICLGRMSEAVSAMDLSARLAEELRQPSQQWHAAVDRATLALFEGRFEVAETLIPEVFRLGKRAVAMDAEVTHRLQTFALSRERGRLREIEETIRRSVEDYPWYPMFRCVLAGLYAEIGKKKEAEVVFHDLAEGSFAALPRDNEWLFGMSFLPEVAATLEDAERAATMYDLLFPYAQLNAYSPPELCTGPVSRYLGILAATTSRWTEAARHFEDALVQCIRMGARPWAARTQYDHASMLAARGRQEDREEARELLRPVRETCTELGMHALGAKAEALFEKLEAPETPTSVEMKSGRAFRREGDYWSIAYEGRIIRLKDVKGLRYIHRLLSTPGRDLHVAELAGLAQVSSGGSGATPDPELRVESGHAGEILDARAKAEYTRRIRDLEEELEEARSWNDVERADRAQGEIDLLSQQLVAAYGLGGRARRAADSSERLRKAVTNRIRDAVARIAREDPALARHLSNSIATGTFCRYSPDRGIPWDLREPDVASLPET
jgi:tetratricopeptide (TPR) repeat protein